MAKFSLGAGVVAGEKMVLVESEATVHSLSELALPEYSGAPDVDALLTEWDKVVPAIAQSLDNRPLSPATGIAPDAIEWLPPVSRPGKLICIGTNYRDHLEEMGVSRMPEFPYAFLRPATCLTAHLRSVLLPDGPVWIDWEAELGVVIGRRIRHARGEVALAAVAGYTVVNDLSARDWIESAPFVGIDWVMQKGWDGFQPTGPWLTPSIFVPEPQSLAIRCEVNGVVKQDSSTRNMLFDVQAIVEHLSGIMTLEPGDVIATGTPAGVGFGRKPRERLQAGDVVRIRIDTVGTLENAFRSRA